MQENSRRIASFNSIKEDGLLRLTRDSALPQSQKSTGVKSDEFWFCVQCSNGHIRVWKLREDRSSPAYNSISAQGALYLV
ncbi:hypothetical protein TNCV_2651161 [Trichonephila clavipes]|nr:hypothetical protein TNCV_2651161 [Trichonephila clavipes]